MIFLGAANRDPEVFPDPDTFQLRRTPNKHLTFGFGMHFCIGAPLARLELAIALKSFATRIPQLTLLTEDLKWRPHIGLRGVFELPVSCS